MPRRLRQQPADERRIGRELQNARVSELVAGCDVEARMHTHTNVSFDAARARCTDILTLPGDECGCDAQGAVSDWVRGLGVEADDRRTETFALETKPAFAAEETFA